MAVQLSAAALAKLDGAHPALAAIVKKAAELCAVQFTVGEVQRTVERQKQLVASGASRTMNSRHIPSADGKSRAVDLTAIVAGQPSWDWTLYFHIADAMRLASIGLITPLEWGGVWDKQMARYPSGQSCQAESAAYVQRQHAIGTKTVFIDGPHFQLPWKEFP
jgi:peptidoglycan L-alanyl-D-glutamate endopeptidase CwlK